MAYQTTNSIRSVLSSQIEGLRQVDTSDGLNANLQKQILDGALGQPLGDTQEQNSDCFLLLASEKPPLKEWAEIAWQRQDQGDEHDQTREKL